jgi:predicted CoA-binding protein
MEFWTEPQMASIHKMLNPRSIAIVGATPRMQYGGRFLAAALKAKDRVRVYAVNPRYDEIMGVKSYPSVTNLPEAPDLVGIVVPYDQVLDVLRESHRKGAGSAIVISAGFAERGVDDRYGRQTAAVLRNGVTVIGGDYWRVWPAVFHANLALARTHTHARVYGLAIRSEACDPLWKKPGQPLVIAGWSDDRSLGTIAARHGIATTLLKRLPEIDLYTGLPE